MTVLPKDVRLAALADSHNVAQFVSFSPGADPAVRHSRIRGHAPDAPFPDIHAAVEAVLTNAASGTVNVRSFLPDNDKGNPFHYRIAKSADAVARVNSLAAAGYTTIVNETLDVHDGGVSGVVLNDLIEFVPDDTPRGVEEPGVASLPLGLGSRLLECVYGFRAHLPDTRGYRIEFSTHPLRVGYRQRHTIVWESEAVRDEPVPATFSWPNKFSRFIGDKAYGLLMADLLGLAVPRTVVISRKVRPFSFGRSTGTAEIWTRPCPREQDPGKHPTYRGWVDPYVMLGLGEPAGSAVVSVLAQEGVAAEYSGATLPRESGGYKVEGVPGFGEDFMQGERSPAPLPSRVIEDVRAVGAAAHAVLGPIRMEFAHDGRQVWVLQLHLATDRFQGAVICSGDPMNGWLDFDPASGLDQLRTLIDEARSKCRGIRVAGTVGVTSHVGDLLRKARIPAVMG
jgi:hypothetical protein